MKKTYIFLVFFMLLNAYVITQETTAFKVWGIDSKDGTAIQIFYTDDGDDIRIPQDDTDLPFEEFFVFLDVRDDKERSVNFNMFAEETITTATYNPDTKQYVYKNTTEYSKFLGNYTMKLRRGQNNYGSDKFALKVIDSSVWTDLVASEDKTRIEVRYQDIVFSFYHLTDYAKVPLTKTIGFFNMEVLLNVFFTTGVVIAAVLAGAVFARLVGGVVPKVNLALIGFAFTWLAISIVLQTLSETGSTAQTVRKIMVVDPKVISVFIGALLFFWIPSKFRPESLSKTRLVSFNIPKLDIISIIDDIKSGKVRPENLDLLNSPNCDWIDLYHYTDMKTNKIRYVRDPDSYWDFFSRVFFGHMRFNHKNTLIVPRKNGFDRMLLVSSLKHVRRNPVSSELMKSIMIGGVVSIIMLLMLSFYLWDFLSVIAAGIFVLLLIFLSYDRLLIKYNIDIDPLDRHMLHAIIDVKFVEVLGNQLRQLTNDNLVMHRALVIQPYEFLAYFIAEYEKELFPSKFEDVFGADFSNDLAAVRKKAQDMENNKLNMLTDMSNLENVRKKITKV